VAITMEHYRAGSCVHGLWNMQNGCGCPFRAESAHSVWAYDAKWHAFFYLSNEGNFRLKKIFKKKKGSCPLNLGNSRTRCLAAGRWKPMVTDYLFYLQYYGYVCWGECLGLGGTR
jgi:hypothetical protein